MNRTGLSLIELLVVLVIIGTLLTVGTFQFNQFLRKSEAEGQTRRLYGDLMELRSQALFEKRSKTFLLSANSYSVYASTDTSVSPLATTTMKRSITNNNSADIVFDSRGMVPAPNDRQTICVFEENDAAVDSVVVSITRLQIGKRKGGMACNAANIVFK